MNKSELLKQIANGLEMGFVYDDYIRHTAHIESDEIKIGVLGQPNSGKSLFLNTLIGTNLPVSNIPSGISSTIVYGESSFDNSTAKDNVTIVSNNRWLEKNGVKILEINKEIIPDEATPLEVCDYLSQCDVCVYLLNAQAALTRTDLFLLNNLNDINIPTLILLSRSDLLSSEDTASVTKYIKGNIHDKKNLYLFESSYPLSSEETHDELIKAIENLISKVDLKEIRSNYNNFYMGYALSALYGACQNKISECHDKQVQIENQAQEKKTKIEKSETDWLKLETELRKKINMISDKLRNRLENRKEDLLRSLSHDIDVCGDIKVYWEKDFPFRLEEKMRMETQASTQMVNQELMKALQWLQGELLRRFQCKMSLATGIAGDDIHSYGSGSTKIDITDPSKLRIVTKIGQAATVIAAGALFASSGIGGIVMATSMISGVGAEFLLRKRNKDSKERIKDRLPEIVSKVQLETVTDFSRKIQDITNDIISHLNNLKSDWIESSIKTIEQEKKTALFNYRSSKWDSIMSKINQLSGTVLK